MRSVKVPNHENRCLALGSKLSVHMYALKILC